MRMRIKAQVKATLQLLTGRPVVNSIVSATLLNIPYYNDLASPMRNHHYQKKREKQNIIIKEKKKFVRGKHVFKSVFKIK